MATSKEGERGHWNQGMLIEERVEYRGQSVVFSLRQGMERLRRKGRDDEPNHAFSLLVQTLALTVIFLLSLTPFLLFRIDRFSSTHPLSIPHI